MSYKNYLGSWIILALFIIPNIFPNSVVGNSQENINIVDINHMQGSYFKYKIDHQTLVTILNTSLSPWPMFCYNTHHTSLSPYIANDGNGLEKWRFRAGGVDSSPVIDSDGNIYFGDKDGWIYSVNPDGYLNWKYRDSDWHWFTTAPALADDGTVYACSWNTKVYAINITNGVLKWKVGVGGSIDSSPVLGDDDTLYFTTMKGSGTGEIVAVNPNGTIKWKYPTGYYSISSPAIGDTGIIYVGSSDNYFYALYPNGTLKWKYKTGDEIRGPISIAQDGTVYVYSWDDYLYAFYPDNGTVRWKTKLWFGEETNPSIGTDGTIYLGGEKLWAVFPNGTLRWIYDPGSGHQIDNSCPAISADGTIYFGTQLNEIGGGDIIALNPDGTEKWRKRIANDWVDSSPCIASDGTVYIGSVDDINRGYLHAFSPVESNDPPETPLITGKIHGKPNEQYYYKIQVHDPDNNPIRFYIEWGDGTTTGWTTERASDEVCYYPHTYTEQGDYIIRCKAKDVFDEESNWGTLEVSMPMTHQHSMYNILVIQYPRLKQVFQQISKKISSTQYMHHSLVDPKYQQDYSVYMKMHAIDQLETTKVQDNLDKS